MAALFQTVLMRLALCGLAASLVLLLLCSRLVRDAFARQLSAWRSLTVFGRFAVCSFLLIGILIGGDKTNNVPPNMNAPLPQMMAGGGSFQTGLTGLSGVWPHTPSYLNPVNLVNPVQTTLVQQTFAAKKAASWNVRGAWKDSFWLDFEDCWVLPWGTNHLSGVEVVSYGQVWQTPFDTNVVASLGVPAEIVPGLSSFAYELTPSNSYRFVWTDAAIDRDTNDLVTAAIELFRNGDTCVTTNGGCGELHERDRYRRCRWLCRMGRRAGRRRADERTLQAHRFRRGGPAGDDAHFSWRLFCCSDQCRRICFLDGKGAGIRFLRFAW